MALQHSDSLVEPWRLLLVVAGRSALAQGASGRDRLSDQRQLTLQARLPQGEPCWCRQLRAVASPQQPV
jgi:hypothetical protein